MQQNKITILSTGPLDALLVDKAGGQNISIDVIPFITTTAIPPSVLQQQVKTLMDEPATVIFTSGNAVDSVAASVNGQAPAWTIFCIGYGTRRRIEKYFSQSVIAATGDNGIELAKEIIAGKLKGPLVFFCGNERRDELPGMLRAAGIVVNEILTYETTATPQKTGREYEGILFFSPSAVKSFFSMNTLKPGMALFAIGQTTAGELRNFTTNPIVLADKPEKEELVNKLIDHFK